MSRSVCSYTVFVVCNFLQTSVFANEIFVQPWFKNRSFLGECENVLYDELDLQSCFSAKHGVCEVLLRIKHTLHYCNSSCACVHEIMHQFNNHFSLNMNRSCPWTRHHNCLILRNCLDKNQSDCHSNFTSWKVDKMGRI